MKTKNLNIRCSEEDLNLIKSLAKTEGCSMGDFIISRATGKPLEELPEIRIYESKEYPLKRRKVLKGGIKP